MAAGPCCRTTALRLPQNPDSDPQVRELCNPGAVYQKLMDFMERLARLGLIHCDFNEFNVMVGGC